MMILKFRATLRMGLASPAEQFNFAEDGTHHWQNCLGYLPPWSAVALAKFSLSFIVHTRGARIIDSGSSIISWISRAAGA